MKNPLIIFIVFSIFCCTPDDKIPDCQESYNIAREDFKNKKFTYFEYQYLTDDTLYNESFRKTLNQYGVKVIFKRKFPISDVVVKDPEEESKKCYQTMMNNQLEAKYGNIFFDRLRVKSN